MGNLNQVRKAGGKVVKGAKSESVLLWKPMQKVKTDANGSPIIVKGKPLMSTFLFLRTFNVFNVAETEGLKLPKVKAPDATLTPIEAAASIFETYVVKNGIPVKYGHDHACYYPSMDMIELPALEQFKNADQFHATSFHEAGHSTGHKDRCNREGIDTFDHFGSERYAKEELVAELSSAMLCAIAGIDGTVDNSAAYLKSWIGKLKEDNKLIISASAQAQKSVDFILGTEVQVQSEDED